MLRPLLTLITACLISQFSLAQEKTFGPYQVHYSVFNSSFITPEVASAYGITRGKNRALINIAVRKQLKSGEDIAQRAFISGHSSDLIHQLPLEFEEIEEQGAIYYIASLKFNDKEMRSFTIKIQPDPNISPYTLKFSKTLYHDE
jgi:uncharacterized protein DUF4426